MELLNKKNINKVNKTLDDSVFVIYPGNDDFDFLSNFANRNPDVIKDIRNCIDLHLYISTKNNIKKYINKLKDTWTDAFQSTLNIEDTIKYIYDSEFDPELYTGKDKVFKRLSDLDELKEIINK